MRGNTTSELSRIFVFNDADLVENRLGIMSQRQSNKLQSERAKITRQSQQVIIGSLGVIGACIILSVVTGYTQTFIVAFLVMLLSGLLIVANILQDMALKADIENQQVEAVESHRVLISYWGNTYGWSNYVQVGSRILKITTFESHALFAHLKRSGVGTFRVFYLPQSKRVVAAEQLIQ